jgi:hypothetical protein
VGTPWTSAGSAAASRPVHPGRDAFTVLICPRCLADRARGRGPYPDLTDAEMHAGLEAAADLGAGGEDRRLLCTNVR